MIRAIILAVAMLIPALTAHAQSAPPLTPEQQALGQMAADQWQREANLRVQVLQLQAENDKLKATAKSDAKPMAATPEQPKP
jgi:hypothetical protein